jgi:hypothetical protein
VSSADSSFNGNLYVAGAIVNTGLTSALALKAPLAAPSFTGLVVSAGDVSMNTNLSVARDSSFNANLYVGGSIVNTGITNALALKANVAAPSFTGLVVSAGDVSMNTNLSVARDSSFNNGLYIGTRLGVGKTANALYAVDVNGNINLSGNIFTGGVLFSAFDNSKDISLNANLSVARDSSFNNGLYVGTRLGVGKTANALYAVDVNGNLNLSGNIFTGGVRFSGFDNSRDISLNANLTVATDSSFNRGLYIGTRLGVGKTANALYAIDVIGNVNLTGNIFTNGNLFSGFDNSRDISLNANLSVARDSSFNSSLFIGGNLNVIGFVNADAYVEKFVNVVSSSGTYTADFNSGLVIYVNSFAGSSTPTLSITNLPTILNQSYVLSVIYRGNPTSTYFSSLNINGVSVPINGTVSLTATTSYYVHQFCIFFTDATTIGNNFVVQSFNSSAPVGLVSPTIYNDMTVNGNINLAGALTLGYTTAPTQQTQMGFITETTGNLVNYASGTNSQPVAGWTTASPKTLAKGVWMINYHIYANDAQTFNITDIRSGLSTTTSGAYTWNVRDLYHRCSETIATVTTAFDFCTQITGILNVPVSTNYTFDVNFATSVNTSDWNFAIKAVRIG